MCGRYILVQKVEAIEKRFNVAAPPGLDWAGSYNISPGKFAPVITSKAPETIQLFQFGLIPFWSKKKMLLINARSEGDHNKENNPDYKGAKGIITKPSFRKPIRSQRCLVPADAFIEGTTNEKLNKPFLVYLRDKQRPFSFAGIWDEWKNPANGEIIHSFAIITTAPNELMQKIPHHRSPVILHPGQEKRWLKESTPLTDITAMLNPFPAAKMNAYPISPDIKNPRNDFPGLIQPIGQRLISEFEEKHSSDVKLQGMGSNKNFTYNKEKPWN